MADHIDDEPSFWGEQPTRRLNRPGQPKRAEFERTREHKVVPRSDASTPPPFYDQSRYGDDWEPASDEAWERFGTEEVEPRADEPRRRRSAAGVDPRVMRVGALAAAAVLLVPVVVALASDDGASGDAVRTEAVATTVVTTIAPQSETTVPGVVEITAAVRPVPDEGAGDADQDSGAEEAAAALGEKPTANAADEQTATDDADDSDDGDEAPAADESATTEQEVSGDQEVNEPECTGTYTVVAGDYWLRFVESSGASLEEWLEANDAQPETQMYEDDELCIPAGAQAPAPIPETTAAPETTQAPDTTEAPETTEPAPSPETTEAPAPETTSAPPPETTAAPAPPAPAPTVAQGAPSTESVCGKLPTQNGSTGASPAEVEAIIREIWPDDIEVRALCIAKREANLRPDLNNWCCYGVFALYFRYVPNDLKEQFGVDEPSDLWDARTNIAIAYQIYLRGGWDPWSQTDPGSG